MGWHAVLARLKPRLSLLDLQRATEDTFDLCIRSSHVSGMFEALRNSDPSVDHSSRWRDGFQSVLETIASRPTRKSQAAECRKIILTSIEKRTLVSALLEISNAETKAALIPTFFPELASQGVSNLVQLIAQQYLYYLLDGLALTVLYTQQFNTTVKIDKFDTHYDAMCKVDAEFMVKKGLLNCPDKPEMLALANAYTEHIVGPLEGSLESIMRDFKQNLYLLSPATPDGSQFIEFLSRYSNQVEAFKRAAANETGTV